MYISWLFIGAAILWIIDLHSRIKRLGSETEIREEIAKNSAYYILGLIKNSVKTDRDLWQHANDIYIVLKRSTDLTVGKPNIVDPLATILGLGDLKFADGDDISDKEYREERSKQVARIARSLCEHIEYKPKTKALSARLRSVYL